MEVPALANQVRAAYPDTDLRGLARTASIIRQLPPTMYTTIAGTPPLAESRLLRRLEQAVATESRETKTLSRSLGTRRLINPTVYISLIRGSRVAIRCIISRSPATTLRRAR